MEVDKATPQEARVEVQGPKRNVVRVESEETQDYMWETLAISQKEAEETGFVPSALGDPRGATFLCDNRCSEKAIRHWQIASMVIKLCKVCDVCHGRRACKLLASRTINTQCFLHR